jgi:hypothetical protein
VSLWIKRDVQLPRNRKTYRLAELLAQGGGNLVETRDDVAWHAIAIVLLEQLWSHVAEHYPSGDITDAPRAELADALSPWLNGSEWARRDVRELLTKSGHLERTRRARTVVRDWLEWTGSDAMRLAKDRKRKRMERATRPQTRPRTRNGRGAGSPALAEQSRDEQRREERTPTAPPAWGIAGEDLLGRLVSEPQRAAVEGLLRAAQEPRLLALTIASYGPGGTDGRYTWAEIGQAALELVVNGGGFNARRLAVFLRKVHEGEPPARANATTGTDAERMRRRAEQLEREGVT